MPPAPFGVGLHASIVRNSTGRENQANSLPTNMVLSSSLKAFGLAGILAANLAAAGVSGEGAAVVGEQNCTKRLRGTWCWFRDLRRERARPECWFSFRRTKRRKLTAVPCYMCCFQTKQLVSSHIPRLATG